MNKVTYLNTIEYIGDGPLDYKNSSVPTIADLNTIKRTTRYVGMEKFVISEGCDYKLIGGTANANWVKIVRQDLQIADGEVVLNIDNDKISTTISLNYNEIDQRIELLGRDNAIISSFSSAYFVKDSFLQSVEYDSTTHIMTFTFKLSDDTTTSTSVDLSGLIDVYISGDGINIEDNVINVKLDTNSESYLSVGVNGISLNGINEINDKLNTIETNAEVNLIDSITLNSGDALPIINKTVNITAGDVYIGREIQKQTDIII